MKAPKTRIFQTAIIVTILSCMLCSYASAATARSSKYLDAYGVYLTPVGSGKVVITVDVDALHTMTKIGATKIYVLYNLIPMGISSSLTILLNCSYCEMLCSQSASESPPYISHFL